MRGASLYLAAGIISDESTGTGSSTSTSTTTNSLGSIPALSQLLRVSRDFEAILLSLRRLSHVLQLVPTGKLDTQLQDNLEECEKALLQLSSRPGLEDCLLRDIIVCLTLLPRNLPGAADSATTVFIGLKRGKQTNDPELSLTALNCLLRLADSVPIFLFADKSAKTETARNGEPWLTISGFLERQRKTSSDACLRRKAVQLVGAFLNGNPPSSPNSFPDKLIKDLVNILDARNAKQAAALEDPSGSTTPKKKTSTSHRIRRSLLPSSSRLESSSSSTSSSTSTSNSSSNSTTNGGEGGGGGGAEELDDPFECEECCNVLELLCILTSSDALIRAVGKKAHILVLSRHLDLNYDAERTRTLIETILINFMKTEKMRTKLHRTGGGQIIKVANSALPRESRWYWSKRQNGWTKDDPYHSASIIIKAVLPGASTSSIIGSTTLAENLMTVFNEVLDERYSEEQLPIRINVSDVIFPKAEEATSISVIPYLMDENSASIEVDMKPKGFSLLIKASKGPVKVGVKVTDVVFKGKLLVGLSKKPGRLQPAWISFAEIPTYSFSCEVSSLSVQVQKILTTIVESVIRNKFLHPKRFYIETRPIDE